MSIKTSSANRSDDGDSDKNKGSFTSIAMVLRSISIRKTMGVLVIDIPDDILTEMLGDLESDVLTANLGGEGVQNGRKLLGIELDVDDGTYYDS